MKKFLHLIAAFAVLAPFTAFAKESIDDFIFFEFYRSSFKAFRKHVDANQALKKAGADELLDICWQVAKNEAVKKYPDEPEGVDVTGMCCYAEVPLLKARPHKGYRPASYAEEFFRRLDFKTFLNSTRQRMVEDDQHALADLKGEPYVIRGKYCLTLDEEYWHEAGCVVADADINGNGKPDWLIAWETYPKKGGTLRLYTMLAAYDVEPTGLIEAVNLDPPN